MDVKYALATMMMVAMGLPGVGQGARAGEAFKVLKTYTDKRAPAPVSKKVVIQCAPSSVGGMEIAGAKVGFYYNAINEEWCRASHACTKTFKEIAKRSCAELKAIGK